MDDGSKDITDLIGYARIDGTQIVSYIYSGGHEGLNPLCRIDVDEYIVFISVE